ncbi:MAG: DNA polymerase III, delta subunit [Candidatus Atelocyanobacterium thalassa isolate SIO64986]|uniref:DNA polymerase III subunit delta n=1 Tax=Candidatus Atelocyanobacterium thalassa isolate SIO64986 TaxID=1527444 RepID=A0A086CIN8_9CHRO|nr:MAG: DNA polymerase III, delta subunit [Candidatus Atelocyanobacterium thalassa isolate SIO64986]
MGIYFFWGEDNFRINQTIQKLKKKVINPDWIHFNYNKIREENIYSILEAINEVMTPAFGIGEKFIWLEESSIFQQCSDDIISEMERLIPAIPSNSNLLLTSSKKPNRKLKSTKIFEKYADIREFTLIPSWKIDELTAKAQEFSKEIGVNLSPSALDLLVESIGNNTRLLWNELEKLSLYNYDKGKPIEEDIVSSIININTYSSLQLARAISEGNKEKALKITINLLSYNEPPLKIVTTLIGQFRTWVIVKLKLEIGEDDHKIIAKAAEISNPNRLFFLKKEIKHIESRDLLKTFPILLDLENNLKKGCDPEQILKNKILELCLLFS